MIFTYSRQIFFLQFLHLVSAGWVMWLQTVLVNTEAKKSLRTSAFSIPLTTWSPVFFQRESTSFLFLSSLIYTCRISACSTLWPWLDLIVWVLETWPWLLRQLLCSPPRQAAPASSPYRLYFCAEVSPEPPTIFSHPKQNLT